MKPKLVILGAAAVLLMLGAASAATLWYHDGKPLPEAADAPLPVPPVPPRISVGQDYDTCLNMLPTDPSGAGDFAESWALRGGGEAATHCLALSKVELGEAERGAEMLQTLATDSHGNNAARAAIYSQADQAWFMAGEPGQALTSATQGLLLSSDDVDLLMDRAIAAGNLDLYQDALDDLTHALDLDPHRPDALVMRAASWRHLGHLDLAQDDIDRALALNHDSAEALLERGILRQRQNDASGARGDWERAITLAPDSGTADLAQQNLALLDAGPERK
jgi:tetratricopeptide (TPR) repeat protein